MYRQQCMGQVGWLRPSSRETQDDGLISGFQQKLHDSALMAILLAKRPQLAFKLLRYCYIIKYHGDKTPGSSGI